MKKLFVILALLTAGTAHAQFVASKNILYPHQVIRIDSNGAIYQAPMTEQFLRTSSWQINQWNISGNECIRFEVRSGDIASNGERAELQYGRVYNQGQTTTFNFDVYFDASNTVLAGPNFNIFQQFHPNANSGSPNVMFTIDNAGANLVMTTVSGVLGGATTTQTQNLVAYATGTWFNFSGTIKWSTGGDGFATVSVNGAAAITITGATLYTSSGNSVGVYPKQGIYRAGYAGVPFPTGFSPSIWYETILKLQ